MMGGEEEEDHGPAPEGPTGGPGSSDMCYFCGKRVYVLERISTEGKFFHRRCFTCHQCGSTLRLSSYALHPQTGRFYCEIHSEELGLEDEKASASIPERTGELTAPMSLENGDIPSENHVPGSSNDHKDSRHAACPGSTEHTVLHLPNQKDLGMNTTVEDGSESTGRVPLTAVPDNDSGIKEETSEVRPVPAPRSSRQVKCSTDLTPVPKQRTVHLNIPTTSSSSDSRDIFVTSSLENDATGSQLEQPQLQLQLLEDQQKLLLHLGSSQDSDSETPASSSCSSSSTTVTGPSPCIATDGAEDEGFSNMGHAFRELKNRRGFWRKEQPTSQTQAQHSRVRSKFSPWNLSSPRLERDQRFSVLNSHSETTAALGLNISDEDEDEDEEEDEDQEHEDEHNVENLHEDIHLYDMVEKTNMSEAEKLDTQKIRTLTRRAKQSELGRFRQAQSIQRRLEEIEVTYKELEDKGVKLEQDLRGEAGSACSPDMIGQWIHLVNEKNAILSEESELMVASRQLELEDKQSMLEMKLRQLELIDSEKTPLERAEEEQLLHQIIEVVDMRNSLVTFLEEKRQKEIREQALE